MKIALCVLFLSLSGCGFVTWDGDIPNRKLFVTFVDEMNLPILGVRAVCVGNDIWPGNELAHEINTTSKPSNSDGLMVLVHSSYGVGGSYKTFGPFEWGHSDSEEVICDFMLSDQLVFTSKLTELYNPKVVVVRKN